MTYRPRLEITNVTARQNNFAEIDEDAQVASILLDTFKEKGIAKEILSIKKDLEFDTEIYQLVLVFNNGTTHFTHALYATSYKKSIQELTWYLIHHRTVLTVVKNMTNQEFLDFLKNVKETLTNDMYFEYRKNMSRFCVVIKQSINIKNVLQECRNELTITDIEISHKMTKEMRAGHQRPDHIDCFFGTG